jgi:hypothetical protein
MGLARHANQRDGNEKTIVDALRGIGASVVRLDKPCDLLVGYRGANFLIEVKLPLGPRGGKAHSELNDLQKEFDQTWRGQFDVVRSPEEAVELLTASVVHLPPERALLH